uniref:Transposase_23 domain-containing protein n=1 Tax=Steinernema glaseri TaxID=37863 RepID=A0A1I8A8U1_9BILA
MDVTDEIRAFVVIELTSRDQTHGYVPVETKFLEAQNGCRNVNWPFVVIYQKNKLLNGSFFLTLFGLGGFVQFKAYTD